MMDSGSFPAALRGPRRYQFQGALDPTLESRDGVVTFGALGADYAYAVSFDSITIGATTTQTIDVSGPGGGTDPGYKVGWIIYLWAGIEGSKNYMLARITAYNNTDPAHVSLTFEAYQAAGSGTFDFWTIRPQFENAYNYIQNPNYSGFDVSDRGLNSPSGRAYYYWPTHATTTNVITSNTDLLQSGYSLYEYKGDVTVYEDEYAINRPYIGKTAGSSRTLTTETTTTTFDYSTIPPTETIVTSSTTEALAHSHSFVAGDFNPSAPEYVAGGAAVYSDGVLITWPTPAYMTKETVKLGEFRSKEYAYNYEEYPPGLGVYRPTLFVYITRSLGDPVFDPTTPSDFFNGL
jgi:hypothetical protein